MTNSKHGHEGAVEHDQQPIDEPIPDQDQLDAAELARATDEGMREPDEERS